MCVSVCVLACVCACAHVFVCLLFQTPSCVFWPHEPSSARAFEFYISVSFQLQSRQIVYQKLTHRASVSPLNQVWKRRPSCPTSQYSIENAN